MGGPTPHGTVGVSRPATEKESNAWRKRYKVDERPRKHQIMGEPGESLRGGQGRLTKKQGGGERRPTNQGSPID